MSPLELDQLVREIGEEVQRRMGNSPLSPAACACSTPAAPRPKNGHHSAELSRPRVEIAGIINQALLQPDATDAEIRGLCHEARQFGFGSVCVAPSWVSLAVRELRGAKVRVATVIGYPHGATLTPVKLVEAEQVLKLGACELEVVVHSGALNSGQLDEVYTEIRLLANCAHQAGARLKVLAEMAHLAEEQKVIACALARLGAADLIKTSAGLAGAAASSDVALAQRIVGGELGIEAAGGINSHARLREMIAAGATRVGTSAGVAIVNEAAHA